MDFGLDKKHEMARSLFKEFAENEVKPLAQEVDETGLCYYRCCSICTYISLY